jgi:hypothetical protein
MLDLYWITQWAACEDLDFVEATREDRLREGESRREENEVGL